MSIFDPAIFDADVFDVEEAESVDTPDFAIPGAYQLITVAGSYGLITITGTWKEVT